MVFAQNWSQPTKRIILLHPHFSDYQRFPTNLVLESDRLAYMGLQATDRTLEDLRTHFRALAQAAPRYIWITDADCVEAELLRDFVREVVDANFTRIIIQARHLPQALVADPALRERMEVWPVDPTRMLTDYLTEMPSIELFGFGRGRIVINGRPLANYNNKLAYQILFFLADHGGRANREMLVNEVVPETVMGKTNSLGVAIADIKQNLGYECVLYKDEIYQLSPMLNWYYDVQTFVENIGDSVRGASSERLIAASGLAAHDFLQTFDGKWVVQRREALRQQQGMVLAVLSRRAATQTERFALALRAAYYNTTLVEAVEIALEGLLKMGKACSALRLYQHVSAAHQGNINRLSQTIRELGREAQQRCS